jgi:desulfoferrodoxin (superoxide reductase-like protein)
LTNTCFLGLIAPIDDSQHNTKRNPSAIIDRRSMLLFHTFLTLLVVLTQLATPSASEISAAEPANPLEAVVRRLETDHADSVNSNGDPGKHTPVILITAEDQIEVYVPHEMEASKPHWIQYLWVVGGEEEDDDRQILGVTQFDADHTSATLAVAVTPGSTVQALAYCNEHGLWKSAVHSLPSGFAGEL